MKNKNKYALLRTLSRGVPGHIGDYFEGLAKALLNATSNCPPDEADLARWDLDLGIEVKARGNDHPFHIPASQLLSHLQAGRGFPFNRYLYCLFKYPTRERVDKNRKRGSLLAKCKTPQQMRYVLAQSPITLHILDISILEALLKKHGSIRNPIERGMENVLEIGHRMLARLSPYDLDLTNSNKFLIELGLSPKTLEVTKTLALLPFKDGLFEYFLQVSITQVLPRKLVARMEHTIFPFASSRFVIEEFGEAPILCVA